MKKILYITVILLLSISCKKQNEWLDIKSNKADVIPTTLEDFQALLDNSTIINVNMPNLTMAGIDNFTVTDVVAQTSGTVADRNAYKWATDIYEGTTADDLIWYYPYRMVEYANIVIEGLETIDRSTINQSQYDIVKGSALFVRAFAYYSLAQGHAKPYHQSTKDLKLGIVLKKSSDVNEVVERATVQQTYDQILSDLKTAEMLLPKTAQFKMRPSAAAAQIMLAKTYLLMGDYEQAAVYSRKVLSSNPALIEFTTLNGALTRPFPTYSSGNLEVVYYSTTRGSTLTSLANMSVSPELYNLYDNDDLRKTIFYSANSTGMINFRGTYNGGISLFSGLAINEAYLICAESLIRTNQINEGMKYLNTLLKTRWKKNSAGESLYVDQVASNETIALTILLRERRKELPFTALSRWEDLRRLNFDTRFAKTLTRTIAGQVYTLPPNDNRYVLPIPFAEIQRSGIEQNQR